MEAKMKAVPYFVNAHPLRLGWEKSTLSNVIREARAMLRVKRMLIREIRKKTEYGNPRLKRSKPARIAAQARPIQTKAVRKTRT
jgi:hypothetical protein